MPQCRNCGKDNLTIEQLRGGIIKCRECALRKSDKIPGDVKAPRAAKYPRTSKHRQRPICEENWGGPCKGRCGTYNQGEFYCHECRKKQAEKNFALKPGEVELYRANVGKSEDKIFKQVVVTNAANGEIEDVEWLWLNKIPLGCATWILGQPNNGKSLMTIAIAACATTGTDFPDGSKNTLPPSRVLMYCGEDSVPKVVRPRLLAHGADLTKVDFLDRKSFRTTAGLNDPEKRPLDLSQDCDVLLELVKKHPDIKVLIVDPITGVFGNKNINKNEEANPVFESLIDFCEASGIAFVGVLHVPKRSTNSSIEKIAGSTSVGGSAKSAFMLSRDPDGDKHDHLLTMVKWNYADNANGIEYKTVSAVAEWKGRQTKTAKIEWGEVIEETADDVLAAQNSKKEAADRQQDKCEAFLMTFLKDGAKRSPDVYDATKQLGFGDTTVKRALKAIGGYHLDRRAQRMGYWMSLEPNPTFGDIGVEPEKTIALAVGEGL